MKKNVAQDHVERVIFKAIVFCQHLLEMYFLAVLESARMRVADQRFANIQTPDLSVGIKVLKDCSRLAN